MSGCNRDAVYLGVIVVLWAALTLAVCKRAKSAPPPVMPSVPMTVITRISDDSGATDSDSSCG